MWGTEAQSLPLHQGQTISGYFSDAVRKSVAGVNERDGINL
jgi:hypothetical protein